MWIIQISVLLLFNFGASNDVCAVDTPKYDEVCLSEEERKLYEIIMEYRVLKKLSTIPFSAKLTKVAQAHAKDLTQQYDVDKNNKCNLHSWSAKGSWSACCYTNDHKKAQCMWDKPREIANYEGNGFEIAHYYSAGVEAQLALEGWKKSKGHNAMLINLGMWKEIEWEGVGIGIFENYAVVWFGRIADSSSIVSCD
ncbi:MAG: hypothetical protein OEX22_03855 [Cyclobacteriaceae bacterium]|nr:hypothetical protein [Cyclobacteriaceae bacterium]